MGQNPKTSQRMETTWQRVIYWRPCPTRQMTTRTALHPWRHQCTHHCPSQQDQQGVSGLPVQSWRSPQDSAGHENKLRELSCGSTPPDCIVAYSILRGGLKAWPREQEAQEHVRDAMIRMAAIRSVKDHATCLLLPRKGVLNTWTLTLQEHPLAYC